MIFMYKPTKYLWYLSIVGSILYGVLFWYPVHKTQEVLGIAFTVYQHGLLGTELYECGLMGAWLRFFGAFFIPLVIATIVLILIAGWKELGIIQLFMRDCNSEALLCKMNNRRQCLHTVPKLLLSAENKSKMLEADYCKGLLAVYGFALLEAGHVQKGYQYLCSYAADPKYDTDARCMVSIALLRYAAIFGEEEAVTLHKSRIEELCEEMERSASKTQQDRAVSRRELTHYVEALYSAPTEEMLQYFEARLCKTSTNPERAHLHCIVSDIYYRMGDKETAKEHLTQAKSIAPNFYTVRKTEESII